jgi:hypothetical protein
MSAEGSRRQPNGRCELACPSWAFAQKVDDASAVGFGDRR